MNIKRIFFFVVVVVGLMMNFAQARTIEIVQASRLEFRNVEIPGGNKEEYIVITGNPAIVRVDEDEIVADRIEYNKTKRYLQVIGDGSYKSKTETVAGKNFRIDVGDQGLAGEDVLIATKELDVQGLSVERLPGQLDVTNGYFSPCSRCDELVNAYAFRAESLTIYPGDRLVGRNVLVLIGDQPVFFLPFLVMPLNDPNRQPRIQIGGLSAGTSPTQTTDDLSTLVDWPFTTGGFGLGFILLRYYNARTPAYSFGIDYTFYELLGETSKSRFYFLAEPPKATDLTNSGAYLSYLFNTTGQIDFNPLADPEDRIPAITFKINLGRRDTGITNRAGDPDFSALGFGINRRTAFSLDLGMTDKNFTAQLFTNNLFDHGYNLNDNAIVFAGLTRFLPELRLSLSGDLLPKWEALSLTNFSAKLGYIIAPLNASNSSVRLEDKNTDNDKLVGAGRFEIKFGVGLNYVPWSGASLTGSNDFLGRYYSTKNPATSTLPDGEFERQVQWSINLAFTQNLFDSRIGFGATYSRLQEEGETPFAFDIIRLRPNYRENFGFNLSLKPFDWLSLTGNEFFERSDKTKVFLAKPANFSINLNPKPIAANATFVYDFKNNSGISWTVNLGNTVASGLSFSVGTGYRYGNSAPFDDLNFTLGYRSPDSRFSAQVSMIENINVGEIRYWVFQIGNWTFGPREDPLTFTLLENYFPPQYSTTPTQPYPRLNGNFSVNYNGWLISFNNELNFAPWTLSSTNPNDLPPSSLGFNISKNSDNPTFSVGGNVRVDLSNFEFYAPQLNGRIDWQIDDNNKLGFGIFATLQKQNPSINTTLSYDNPNFFLNTNATWALPDNTNPNFELRNLSLNFGIDILPGFAVSGNALAYQRIAPTIAGTHYRDTFTLGNAGLPNSGINFVFATAREGKKKPEFYFTVRFQGSYTYSDDPAVKQNSPTFINFANESFTSFWRPIFIFTFDMCCYVVEFKLDSTPKGGGAFSLSIKLGNLTEPLITADPKNVRFLPSLPFPPIPVSGGTP